MPCCRSSAGQLVVRAGVAVDPGVDVGRLVGGQRRRRDGVLRRRAGDAERARSALLQPAGAQRRQAEGRRAGLPLPQAAAGAGERRARTNALLRRLDRCRQTGPFMYE